MLQALKYGFRIATLNLKLWGMLYLINILFAGLVVVPLLYYLGDKLAFTKVTDRLIGGFDFTLFNDFLNQYPEFLRLMSTQTAMIGLLFLLFYMFLNGGILARLKNYETDIHRIGNFWTNCGKYFWRLFRLAFYFVLIHLGIALLFFTIFNLSVRGGLDRFTSEAAIFSRAKICLSGYVLTALFFFMVQDYAKVMIVARDRRWIFREFWGAFKLAIKNSRKTYGLYLLLTGIFIVVSIFYSQIDGWIHQTGIPSLLLFLIGQVYVLLQIGFKLVNLGSVTEMFRQVEGIIK